MTTFGEYLRERRKASNLSQRDLAALTGVDYTYISKIECNQVEYLPSEALIRRLAQALSCEAIQLLALAGKLPVGLQAIVVHSPQVAALLRILSEQKLSDEVYEQMLALARRTQ